MKAFFTVTFSRVNDEEAAIGDTDRHGFLSHDGRELTIEELGDLPPPRMTLREAIRLTGGYCFDSGRWFTCEAYTDPHDGDEVELSIHPPRNVTPSSYARLRRILCDR